MNNPRFSIFKFSIVEVPVKSSIPSITLNKLLYNSVSKTFKISISSPQTSASTEGLGGCEYKANDYLSNLQCKDHNPNGNKKSKFFPIYILENRDLIYSY